MFESFRLALHGELVLPDEDAAKDVEDLLREGKPGKDIPRCREFNTAAVGIDWDNDGRDEVLTASFEGVHLFHAAGRGDELRWTQMHLAAGDQDSKPARGSGRAPGRVARRYPLFAMREQSEADWQ